MSHFARRTRSDDRLTLELFAILGRRVREVAAAQNRRGGRVVDRRRVDVAAVLGIDEEIVDAFAQRRGQAVVGNPGPRVRRPDVLEIAVAPRNTPRRPAVRSTAGADRASGGRTMPSPSCRVDSSACRCARQARARGARSRRRADASKRVLALLNVAADVSSASTGEAIRLHVGEQRAIGLPQTRRHGRPARETLPTATRPAWR